MTQLTETMRSRRSWKLTCRHVAVAAGARKMAECHAAFRKQIDQAVLAATRDVFEVALPPAAVGLASEAATRLAQSVVALDRLAQNALTQISVVVFELQDGVAIQNMYDMLAQREAGIVASGFFADIGGKPMSPTDLVRNLLLNHIADEDARYDAYDRLWRPIERTHGDGNAERLESFLRGFMRQRGTSAASAPSKQSNADAGNQQSASNEAIVNQQLAPPAQSSAGATAPLVAGSHRGSEPSTLMPPPPPAPLSISETEAAGVPSTGTISNQTSGQQQAASSNLAAGARAGTGALSSAATEGRKHASAAAPTNLQESFASLLRHLGGSSGAASLYAAGTTEVPVDVVDPAAASRAALQVLTELKAFSEELAEVQTASAR